MKYYGYSDADEAVLEIDITREDVIECIDKAVKGQEVDVIIGGPPCQAYSSLGRAKADNAMQDDQRNYLFESYVKVLNYYKRIMLQGTIMIWILQDILQWHI